MKYPKNKRWLRNCNTSWHSPEAQIKNSDVKASDSSQQIFCFQSFMGCLLIIAISLPLCGSFYSCLFSGSDKKEDAFQVEVFSNTGAIIVAQEYLENKISKNIKFNAGTKIEKLPSSGSFRPPKGVNPQKLWVIDGIFKEKNAFNTILTHSYSIIVEFSEGQGYRVILATVDDTIIP